VQSSPQRIEIHLNFIGEFELPNAEREATPEELAEQERIEKVRVYDRQRYQKRKAAGYYDKPKKELKKMERTTAAEADRDTAKAELAKLQKPKTSIKDHLSWFDKFIAAMRRAPKRLIVVIEDILGEPPERQEQQRQAPERKQSRGIEI